MSFRLVIFDLDGTLVDTLGDISDSLNLTLRHMGLAEVPEERVATMVGEGVVRLLEKALGDAAARAGEALPIFRARYEQRLVARTRPYPGIPELLAQAPQTKAVATNKPGDMARRIVSGLNLERHLARVLGDGDVERRKPDPEMVERLLGELGVPREETLFVGDGIVDSITARATGIPHCAVPWGYTPRELLRARNPEFWVESVADLHRLLTTPP